MEDVVNARPSVCFEVLKIIGVSIGNGNMRNYQVQWAPTWISGFNLVGCQHLIEEFLHQQSEKCQSVADTTKTTGTKDADDLTTDTREDVSRDGNVSTFTSGWHSQEEDIPDQASTVVNIFPENQESNTCLYSNTSSDNVIVKVETNIETNVSSEEIYTRYQPDMDESNQTNTNFDSIKTEDIYSNEKAENDPCLSQMGKDTYVNNDCVNAYEEDDGTLLAINTHGKPRVVNSENEFQNNTFKVEREEITLDAESETDQTNLSNDYENSGSLEEHVCSDASDNVHKCTACNKTFAKKSNLTRHVRVHTGDKPFECTECDKTFANKSNLNSHLRLHAGVKPYRCLECNKVFAQKQYLKRHLRVHTGEKPFDCTECSKAFTTKQTLTFHLKLHKGV